MFHILSYLAIAIRLEVSTIRLESITIGLDAVATRLETVSFPMCHLSGSNHPYITMIISCKQIDSLF